MRKALVFAVLLVLSLAPALAAGAWGGDAFFAAVEAGSPAPELMFYKCFSKALPDGSTLELWAGPGLPAANPDWKTGGYVHVYLVEQAEQYDKLVRPGDGEYPPVAEAYGGSGCYRVLADCEMPAGQVELVKALLQELFAPAVR